MSVEKVPHAGASLQLVPCSIILSFPTPWFRQQSYPASPRCRFSMVYQTLISVHFCRLPQIPKGWLTVAKQFWAHPQGLKIGKEPRTAARGWRNIKVTVVYAPMSLPVCNLCFCKYLPFYALTSLFLVCHTYPIPDSICHTIK